MRGDGDCYEAAARRVAFTGSAADPPLLLVHGIVTGQGAIRGLRFGHGWVEFVRDGLPMVLDPSNGRSLELPRSLYYRIGEIAEDEVRRYSADEARRFMVATGHYGHWDPVFDNLPVRPSDLQTEEASLTGRSA